MFSYRALTGKTIEWKAAELGHKELILKLMTLAIIYFSLQIQFPSKDLTCLQNRQRETIVSLFFIVFFFFETRICYVAQANLKLTILLPSLQNARVLEVCATTPS